MGDPFRRHMMDVEIQPMDFEQMQRQEGVIGIVIVRGAVDFAQERAFGLRIQSNSAGMGTRRGMYSTGDRRLPASNNR